MNFDSLREEHGQLISYPRLAMPFWGTVSGLGNLNQAIKMISYKQRLHR